MKIWFHFIGRDEFSCPSNKKFPCIDGDHLCDGRQKNKCENVCAAPKTDFPLYDKSTGECKQQYARFIAPLRYCGQRKGSKHVHNQCYSNDFRDASGFLSVASAANLKYRCLNRNDIKERVVAGLKIFRNNTLKRVNFFDYFRDHNNTHIKCGNNSLSKNLNCYDVLFDRQKQAYKEYVL